MGENCYKCEKCGKVFNKKYNYERHSQNKRSCIDVNNLDNICGKCTKSFATGSSLKRHEKICNIEVPAPLTKSELKVREMEKIIENLRIENLKLQELLRERNDFDEIISNINLVINDDHRTFDNPDFGPYEDPKYLLQMANEHTGDLMSHIIGTIYLSDAAEKNWSILNIPDKIDVLIVYCGWWKKMSTGDVIRIVYDRVSNVVLPLLKPFVEKADYFNLQNEVYVPIMLNLNNVRSNPKFIPDLQLFSKFVGIREKIKKKYNTDIIRDLSKK